MKPRSILAPFNNAVIHTAHDVRTIRPCALCRGLGRRDAMLNFDAEGTRRYAHGRCHIQVYGWKHFLRVPRNQLLRLTLADLGGHARALLSHLYGDRPRKGSSTRNK